MREFWLFVTLATTLAACGDNETKYITIGGTVSGLSGSGLVLTNDGRDELAIDSNGSFTFATPIAAGQPYAVAVAMQPSAPTQSCVVTGGTGTSNTSVTDVEVTCMTDVFTVGGIVTGLTGSGLVLENNGTDALAIAADGTFAFATPLASGTAFAVTVKTHPSSPTQTCTVAGGTGTIGAGHVTTVVVDCTVDRFTIGGSVSGLAGTLVLQNNGGDDITLTSNGSFAFPTTVASGSTYSVSVLAQPSAPSQTCVVTSGTGTVIDADISDVRVECTTNTFAVGGTVTGLEGSGLVLQNNGGDNLAISGDGIFTFATPVASGAPYAVTVLAQPSNPTQECMVASGTGTMAGADVTDVTITCTTRTFTIGGTVTGLAGGGLVLQNSGGDDLAIAADGSFAFSTPVASGETYSVTVLAQPTNPSQTCSVSGATGVVGGGNVTSVVVNCSTNTYTIGGTISGLAGTVVLQNNAGDNLTLTANGSFAFATPIESGATYAVTVLTDPTMPSQTCTVANGSGTVTSANVTTVAVTCVTNRFTVGGTVSGLAGVGLVLQNNAGDDLAIAGDGSFTFTTSIASGSTYEVTAAVQPTNPSQTCVVTNGAGTMGGANVANVSVTCTTDTFLVGGTVSGLAGTGLVLRNNGGDDFAITQNGTFSFPTRIASGSPYAATVFAQPMSPWQTCTVTNGGGTVTNGDITNIAITCTTNTYTIGGTVAGLAGSGLVLQNNAGDDLTVTGSTFTFSTPLASGSTFGVTIKTQPTDPSQTCSISGGTGTVGGAAVTSVMVNCTTNSYAVGGTIAGLSGTVVLQNNGGDDLTLTANGAFSFATPILSGATYDVTVSNQPGSPIAQTCTVSAGSGTVANGDVTSVVVTCTTNRYTIGGTISGLASGASVVLRDNGADDLMVSANGSFTFTTTVPSGQPYAVTVQTNPTSPISQNCTVTNGTGTVVSSNVTSVMVTCVTNQFTIGGTVSGLVGSGLVLQNNGGDDLAVTADGSFTFAAPVTSGGSYSVTVATHPTTPIQTCTVTNGSGTVGSTNVTNVAVTCANGPSCAQLVTTANVWGQPSRGIDLRPYTNSTLDWIGCASVSCAPSQFFCTDEANGIYFGTTSTGALRALVDPGNAAGDSYPTSYSSCCSASSPREVCNAPMAGNSGVGGIDAGDALCKAMGFASGVVVNEIVSNSCPKPHTTTADGSNWTSNWSTVQGFGQQYRCTR